MSDEKAPSVDLIRWTFGVNPEKQQAILDYLAEQGTDAYLRDEAQVVVLWDEPEADLDEVVEELWAINGGTFEVTHEEFHRSNLSIYECEEDGGEEKAVA